MRMLGCERIELGGEWGFQLDEDRLGERRGWSRPDFRPEGVIHVGAVWQAQGIGQQRSQLRHDYQGKAWYQRRVVIPADWQGRRVALWVGGALRHTRAYVNGKEVGESRLITTPFSFDVTDAVVFGRENVVTMAVDNLLRSGKYSPEESPLAGGQWDVSEPVGAFNSNANWGGVYGKVELVATGDARADSIRVRGDVERKTATFDIGVDRRPGSARQETRATVTVTDSDGAEVGIGQAYCAAGEDSIEVLVPISGMRPWHPEEPHLYSARVIVDGVDSDTLALRFGVRKIETRGTRVLLDGAPVYLRGFCIGRADAVAGMLPVEKGLYLERFERARRMGFNYVRWHSTMPPEEAFDAADEAGMLMVAELPVVFTPFFMPHVEQLHEEMESALLHYRHHPSFFALAFGNEFNVERDFGDDEGRGRFMQEIARLYDHAKRLAGDILVMSNCGYSLYPTDMVAAHAGFVDDRPTVKHESGGYRESLPDVDLAERFTGVLLPDKLVRKREWLDRAKLRERYAELRRHSERLQQSVRKWHFEKIRRIGQLCGYQYWQMADAPPGCYTDGLEDGILNYFWAPTKAVTEGELAHSNGPTALLLTSDIDDRTIRAREGKRLGVMVSHFGRRPLRNARVRWRMMHGSNVPAQGTLPVGDVPLGELRFAGEIVIDALPLSESARLHLVAELDDDVGRASANSWNLWAFRGRLDSRPLGRVVTRGRNDIRRMYPFIEYFAGRCHRADLVVTGVLDPQVFDDLVAGASVLWLAQHGQFDNQVRTDYFADCLAARGTVIEDHPALAGFPHEGFCDLQFFNLMEGGFAVRIPESDHLWMTSARDDTSAPPPNTMTPIIWGLQTTGEWTAAERGMQRVAWLIEARVGRGKLLLSTLNLLDRLTPEHPEALALFEDLLLYATSRRFQPRGEISVEELSGLLTGYLS